MFAGLLKFGRVWGATLLAHALEWVIWGLGKVAQARRPGPNPYLAPDTNFGPIDNPCTVPRELTLTHGSLPPALLGTSYIRNGPNIKRPPIAGYHWFDGDGMIHRCTVTGENTVVYASDWVATPRLAAEDRAGKPLVTRIGDLQGVGGLLALALAKVRGWAQVEMPGAPRAGTCNTALVVHAGKVLALVENALPFEIVLEKDGSIGSVGYVDFDGQLDHAMTAHPKLDGLTQDLYFFAYSRLAPTYRYGWVGSDGTFEGSWQVNLERRRPAMTHDMAVTASYGVLIDCPLVFDGKMMVKTGGVPLTYDASSGARFGLVPLKPTSADAGPDGVLNAQWFEIEPCYIFHTGGAWDEEDGNVVVILAIRYLELDLNWLGDGGFGVPLPDGHLYEYRLDRRTGSVTETKLMDASVEFPVVHPRCIGTGGRPRYVYMARAGATEHGIRFDAIIKYDMDERCISGIVELGQGRAGGEPMFIPHGEGGDEDDGSLVLYVYDTARRASDFVVYDAKAAMSPEPVAVAQLPNRVPFGFHGYFVQG